MRLTNYLRDAFVRNVSNNIPVVKAPPLTLIQEMCYNLADPRLKIIYDDEKLRKQLQTSWVYLEETRGYIHSLGVDWEELPAVINYREKLQKRHEAIDKLRRAAGVDRRLTLREILEKIFGLIPGFKSKDELLDDEFQKFLLDQPEDELAKHADAIVALKYFFKAYATDGRLRDIIEKRRLTELNVNPAFTMADFKAVPKEWRDRLPEYVKDYVSLNQFMQ